MTIVPSYPTVIAATFGGALLYSLALLCKARYSFYQNRVKKGLPMPPWNPLFGHLIVLDKTFKKYKLPRDMRMNDVFGSLSKESDESGSLLYVDLWPFLKPTALITPPRYAQQAELILDPPDALFWSMHPVTGPAYEE